MKLKSLYSFNIGHPIYNNAISIGKFDGEKFSFTYATLGGKIIIYSPYDKQEQDNHDNKLNPVETKPVLSQIQKKGNYYTNKSNMKEFSLNVNKEVNCITYGKIDVNSNKSCIYIGSPSSIMCFDVIENKTIFNKEVEDGVYCIITGIYSTFSMPLVIVGGNCSLQGFDINGEEKFWTVTGGNTLSLAFNDVDDDSFQELIVGTDDYTIRYIKKEQSINDIPEESKVILLHSISNSKFIYALDNGTIGLYHKDKRIWQRNEIGRGKATSIINCDINRDNRNEVIVSWTSGKVLIFSEDNGETIEELGFNGIEISKIFWENLSGALNNSKSVENSNDSNQLIVCLSNGVVCGYDYDEELSNSKVEGYSEENKQYQRLLNEKKVLLSQVEKLKVQDTNKRKVNLNRVENTLKGDVTVEIDLQSNSDDKCADLIIIVSEKFLKIKQVIIFSDQLYNGGSSVFEGNDTNELTVKVKNPKDMKISLHIKVLVGVSMYSTDFQVFEFSKIIPKYCYYILLRDIENQYNQELNQGLIFNSKVHRDRLIIWIDENFNIHKSELEKYIIGDCYDVRFLSLRTDKILQIFHRNNEIRILTDEIELAGNIFQDLCSYFKEDNIDSKLYFNNEIECLIKVIQNIKQLDGKRNFYNISMSEVISQIKDLYVRAEDLRIIDDTEGFINYFKRINIKNEEVLNEFNKRLEVYEDLKNNLKKLNEIIQYFSNLKYGIYKTNLINNCRDCLKKKNYEALVKYLQQD